MSLFIVSLPELHSLANSNTVISVLFLIKLTTLTCLSFKGSIKGSIKGSFNFPLNKVMVNPSLEISILGDNTPYSLQM